MTIAFEGATTCEGEVWDLLNTLFFVPGYRMISLNIQDLLRYLGISKDIQGYPGVSRDSTVSLSCSVRLEVSLNQPVIQTSWNLCFI